MKKLVYNKSVFVLLIACMAFGQIFAQDATRVVTKSFNIKPGTKIEVRNKFGNVIINKWDKNVFDLKVEIDAKGKTDAKTQKILDAINIDITDKISSGYLSIETEIDDINGNSSFSVNYEIHMPNTNPMQVSNSFGNLYMGSYVGDLEVEVKYGQFQAEDLDKADIRVEFSNARCEIETLSSGKIDLRYSKMSVEEMGDIEISSQFSDMEIEKAGHIELDGRYGKFEIENVKSIVGDIQFIGLDVEMLEETIVLETRYGNGIGLEKVSNKFKKVEIEGQFSSIDINMEHGATALLDFELQFGNLRANGEGINFTKVIKEQSRSEYEGYLGKSTATSTINVQTKHGNIRFEVE